MYLIRNAGAFPSKKQAVVFSERCVAIFLRSLRGQQNEASRGFGRIFLPGFVSRYIGQGKIIHSGAFQLSFRPDEAAGLDNVDGKAETSAKSNDCPGILRDVGLEKYNPHRMLSKNTIMFAE